MESMQHVSRSGEKGWTASLWLVGESRMSYVGAKESMQNVSLSGERGTIRPQADGGK